MYDFVVVGGGINGLLLARELAQAQARVVLVERGQCGMEASWAGGGIISPLYPWRYAAAITALASWAQDFYPALVQELLSETGIDAQLQQTGLLMLDADDQDQALAWAGDFGRRIELLDRQTIVAKEPRIGSDFTAGLWMPDVANVRNPRLIKALLASLQHAPNADILEHSEVTAFLRQGHSIEGVTVQKAGKESTIHAGATVVCAGAWSNGIMQMLGLELAVEPVKGQMLLYQVPPHTISAIVLSRGRYIIPRPDGHLLAGSTLEYCGFDKSATTQAGEELAAAASSLLPQLAGCKPIAQWAGLRPGTAQGLPFIGAMPQYKRLYVNAGQFRNGLVLAPASARLLADSLLGRAAIVDPTPYLPAGRMTAKPQ